MLKVFNCNLHIHTCLSPCGDLDMHPSAIVKESLACGLDVIAITDHNSSENVEHVMKAANTTSLMVLPGMEVTSREEAHVLTYFDDLEILHAFQEVVYSHLDGLNDENAFGCQAIVNEIGEVEGFNQRLLIGATRISLEGLVKIVHDMGGLAVAAHIDRESFSVLGQLGFIPEQIAFDALEISARTPIAKARQMYPELAQYTFITSSDAHYLMDIGRTATKIRMKEPSVDEMRMAFMKKGGREVVE
ncbi:MAG: PHP domain-containing protein [Deltaproteobacteria bacterium]|nr:PHP domain-containing protein [Deltaproteobacteria bacterium]